MQIKFEQTRQAQIEVAEWIAGIGEVTAAVRDAWLRNGLTFGAALITRQVSGTFRNN